MKGDFTRNTFSPKKHYCSVLMQQGRVQLDADFNEYTDIQDHLRTTTTGDMVGGCGGPQNSAGFEIVVINPTKSAELKKKLSSTILQDLIIERANTLKGKGPSEKNTLLEKWLGEVLPGRLKNAQESEQKRSLQIAQGRYYVDGILCENDCEGDSVSMLSQVDFPAQDLSELIFPNLKKEAVRQGYYLAYLDVWQRHITALEDKEIREVALLGPDTTTRTKTVWQVKLAYIGKNEATCSAIETDKIWSDITKGSSGQMSVSVQQEDDDTKPCIVPAQGGYHGLENQLYRVEIHQGGKAGKATFKWSRENGSVVFPIKFKDTDSTTPKTSRVELARMPKDRVLALQADDWVEILENKTDLYCQPGIIARVLPDSNFDQGVIVLEGDISKHKEETSLKMRRWDFKVTDKVKLASDKAIPIPTDETTLVPLESGINVRFTKDGVFQTGDYWLIPARTATRDIEWPFVEEKDGRKTYQPQKPKGIRHHFCRLAVLSYNDGAWNRIHDCRRLFPPLTEMIHFSYVGGDGQEAIPGKPLPLPLQVNVTNGQQRVSHAKVQFKVINSSNGWLQECKDGADCSIFNGAGIHSLQVMTGPDGIASACWRLDSTSHSQQVEATLIEVDGKTMTKTVAGEVVPFLPPIRFNANLSIASQVAYDPPKGCDVLKGKNTVQDAIDALCLSRPTSGGGATTGIVTIKKNVPYVEVTIVHGWETGLAPFIGLGAHIETTEGPIILPHDFSLSLQNEKIRNTLVNNKFLDGDIADQWARITWLATKVNNKTFTLLVINNNGDDKPAINVSIRWWAIPAVREVPAINDSIRVGTDKVFSGTLVTFTGTSSAPGATIKLRIIDAGGNLVREVGSVVADEAGFFESEFVPTDDMAVVGAYRLEAVDPSGITYSADFTVTKATRTIMNALDLRVRLLGDDLKASTDTLTEAMNDTSRARFTNAANALYSAIATEPQGVTAAAIAKELGVAAEKVKPVLDKLVSPETIVATTDRTPKYRILQKSYSTN